MPLTRAHLTRPQRIILPALAVFFAVVGVTWLSTPRERLLATPGLEAADAMLTIRAWGGLFLSAAIVMTVALVRGRSSRSRELFAGALIFCALILAIWTVVLVVAIFTSHTSAGAWAWPFVICAMCAAAYVGLLNRPRT